MKSYLRQKTTPGRAALVCRISSCFYTQVRWDSSITPRCCLPWPGRWRTTPACVWYMIQGDAAEWLKQQKEKMDLDTLVVNPFQPYMEMSNVLGAADVLVANLEPDAGIFSVPSKVLAYHCAGRPMLIAVPEENLAAKIVTDNGSGLVGNPSDTNLFCRNAESLYHDQQNRVAMGRKAQAYAMDNFDIGKIADRFEGIIQHVTAGIGIMS